MNYKIAFALTLVLNFLIGPDKLYSSENPLFAEVADASRHTVQEHFDIYKSFLKCDTNRPKFTFYYIGFPEFVVESDKKGLAGFYDHEKAIHNLNQIIDPRIIYIHQSPNISGLMVSNFLDLQGESGFYIGISFQKPVCKRRFEELSSPLVEVSHNFSSLALKVSPINKARGVPVILDYLKKVFPVFCQSACFVDCLIQCIGPEWRPYLTDTPMPTQDGNDTASASSSTPHPEDPDTLVQEIQRLRNQVAQLQADKANLEAALNAARDDGVGMRL